MNLSPLPTTSTAPLPLPHSQGLEFDAVFVAGVEEGLLPHYYSSGSLEEIEEERRLLCV